MRLNHILNNPSQMKIYSVMIKNKNYKDYNKFGKILKIKTPMIFIKNSGKKFR
jgi:hypothetical protein